MAGPIRALLLLLLGVLILRTLLLSYPAYEPLPNRDSGVFLYTGWRILQGEIPYRDVWDHKPPAVFYIDALGLLIGGGSAWGVWLLELLALAGAAALSYALMRRMFGPLVASLASLAWVAKLPPLLSGGNLTEEYVLPLQWLALWLFLRAEGRSRYTWEGYAIGAFGAMAFLLRQNLIGVWLAIGLYVALRAPWRRDWRRVQPLGEMCAGGAGILLAALAYFAGQGALANLWQAAFRFSFAYGRTAPEALWLTVWTGLQLLLGLSVPALAAWPIGLFYLLRWRRGLVEPMPVLAVCILALPTELVLSGLSGRLYTHYYVTWLPACAVLAGSVLWALERRLIANWAGGLKPGDTRQLVRRLAWSGTAVVVLPFALLVQVTPVPAAVPGAQSIPLPYADVTRYVLQTTGEGDSVLIWGAEATLNFVTARRSPTRFVYQYPLYMPGYQEPGLARDLLADIATHKPRLIVDTSSTNPAVPPIDAAARRARLPGLPYFELQPEMDEVFAYIAAHYRPARTFEGGWVAYRYAGSEQDGAQVE